MNSRSIESLGVESARAFWGPRSKTSRGRAFFSRLILSGSCVFSACPLIPPVDAGVADVGGVDSSDVDTLEVPVDGGGAPAERPECDDDEALDREYDKRLGIDCNAVRAAVDARRTPEQRAANQRLVDHLRTTLRRCCVSREQLVQRLRPSVRPPASLVDDSQRREDRFSGMIFCDRLTREIATRQYIEDHPECLQVSPPNGGDAIPSSPVGGDL